MNISGWNIPSRPSQSCCELCDRHLAGDGHIKRCIVVTLDALKNIRFVVDASGKESAVQVSMKDWKTLLEYLEEMEDRSVVKENIERLRKGPEKSGALAWQDVKGQW